MAGPADDLVESMRTLVRRGTAIVTKPVELAQKGLELGEAAIAKGKRYFQGPRKTGGDIELPRPKGARKDPRLSRPIARRGRR